MHKYGFVFYWILAVILISCSFMHLCMKIMNRNNGFNKMKELIWALLTGCFMEMA